MFRIAWKSLAESSSGVGKYILNEADARDIINSVNRACPEIVHWIEPKPPSPLNLIGHRCSYGDESFVPEASPMKSLSPVESPKPTTSPTSPRSPLAEFDPKYLPRLNIRGHNCSYGDTSLVLQASPQQTPRDTIHPVLSQGKLKKACSFGETTVFVYSPCPSMSPSPHA